MSSNPQATPLKTLDETDKKCPNCGGVMDYDATALGLKCPYCDYEEEIIMDDGAPSVAEENILDLNNLSHNFDWGTETKTVLCQSCGAESIFQAFQISSVCPYCDSNQVTQAHTENTLAPGGVIPFSISDESASKLFKSWIKRKWFCPKLAKESAMAESFHGVYLPYWTFDSNTSTQYSARYSIVKTVGSGENRRTKITWHSTRGSHQQTFDDELILASKHCDQNNLNKIAPFRTNQSKPYQPEYIAGYVAQRYSIDLKEGWEEAKASMSKQIRNKITSHIQYNKNASQVTNLSTKISFNDLTYKYLFLPIWTSSYQYNNKIYHFMVNGQTGKVAGDAPISKVKVAFTIIAILIAFALCHYLYYYL